MSHQQERSPPTLVQNSESKPPTILLVEDDDDIRMALAEVLEGEGYRVIQNTNALGACGWFGQDKTCDLMLCDFMMPGEPLALIKYARSRGIPTIMMTAASRTLNQRLKLEGMADIPIIQKPFDLSHVIAEVQRLLPLFSNKEVEVLVA